MYQDTKLTEEDLELMTMFYNEEKSNVREWLLRYRQKETNQLIQEGNLTSGNVLELLPSNAKVVQVAV